MKLNVEKLKQGGSSKNWIQSAVNPKHKGFCTPITKSTCTPRRKALALRFKSMAKSRKHKEGGMLENINNIISKYYQGGGLSRKEDYGSKSKPYPSVNKKDFAGDKRSYPIPTKADAVDALRLAGLHGRSDIKAKVYKKYPELKKHQFGGLIELINKNYKQFKQK